MSTKWSKPADKFDKVIVEFDVRLRLIQKCVDVSYWRVSDYFGSVSVKDAGAPLWSLSPWRWWHSGQGVARLSHEYSLTTNQRQTSTKNCIPLHLDTNTRCSCTQFHFQFPIQFRFSKTLLMFDEMTQVTNFVKLLNHWWRMCISLYPKCQRTLLL